MTRPSFTEALATRPWLLADGATGTNYFQMGLESGDAPEMWNLEHPERVRSLHRRFIEAGADIVTVFSRTGRACRQGPVSAAWMTTTTAISRIRASSFTGCPQPSDRSDHARQRGALACCAPHQSAGQTGCLKITWPPA